MTAPTISAPKVVRVSDIDSSIAAVLKSAPPLTPAQLDRITGLLRGGS